MRLAYIAHVNVAPESGVAKKIFQQVRTWKTLGAEVRIQLLTRSKELASKVTEEGWGSAFMYAGGPFSLSRQRTLHRLVEELAGWRPDLVYLRRDLFYPAYRRIAQDHPVVVEVNSDELAELRLYSRSQFLYHALTRRLLDTEVAGFVFVTRELAQNPYYASLPAKKKVIANGIDLESLPVLPPARNQAPVLAFLGQPAPWHGVDKILKLAALRPDWTFHLMGLNPEPGMPPNVRAHGMMAREAYLPLLAQSDVAIGTLALHRNKMNEASPLKVREYLALGLPVVIGYKDTDFPEGAPFLLELPNRENNVEASLGDIERFVHQWMGKRVPREAVAHLDYRVKEKERLEFFAVAIFTRSRKKGGDA